MSLCTHSVPGHKGRASTAHRYTHGHTKTHTCLKYMSLYKLCTRSKGRAPAADAQTRRQTNRHRHTYMHTHIYVHVQTLSDAMYQVANYHLLRKFLLQSRATGLVHQLSKGMSRGVEHEKKRVRSCEGKGFADQVRDGRQTDEEHQDLPQMIHAGKSLLLLLKKWDTRRQNSRISCY